MSIRGLALFVLRRLAALALLLVIISFGVFSLLHLAPGSAEQVLLQGRAVDEETRNEIRDAFNLNEPFMEQYRLWATSAMRLDFGESIRTGEPVLTAIRERSGLTIFLGLYGFAVAMVTGVSLGILSAVKSRTGADRGIVMFSIVGASAPAFVTGVFLLYVFAVLLGWFPAFGQGAGLVDRLWHLTLPALALALGGAALVVRLTRAGMLGALEQDYVTFARARGLSSRRVLLAYALRNALIPVVNAGALMLAFMLTGAALVEVTFALPGIGALLVEAVEFKDLPIVQGLSMVLATVVIVINLLTDVVYLFIDPRITYGEATP